ncbi:nucleotidyltransferase domain-containing protein [Salinisphaera japonica]|uniref:Cyclic GMP-AMP synthase n=1 Tax=Salinisphaera japonica YTM-1 TaxID=1209778 RepID=A0A423PFN4_9GAMM|nr:nucleotidyltransferase [Salinisphaera japonica]ROO24402.1 hypothetical protein SAJA_14045 [Salinisphaera japonica YTM-1]
MTSDVFLSEDAFRRLKKNIAPSSKTTTWEKLLLKYLERISLTPAQYELIDGRYNTVADILDRSSDPLLEGIIFLPQGSFRTRTVIRPENGEVDVDAVAWLPRGQGLPAKFLYQLVRDELDKGVRTEQGIEEKNRCIRVLYADEDPAFHMDVTPARNAVCNANADGSGELEVSDLRACENPRETGYKPSNPVDFAKWVQRASEEDVYVLEKYDGSIEFREAAKAEPLPSHSDLTAFDPLRATIKMLKAHRDRYFSLAGNAKQKPISVLLTTLACHSYLRVAHASTGQPMRPIDAITAIIDELPRCFDQPRQGEQYRVENPVSRDENFAERWNDDQMLVLAFRSWHGQISRDIRLGLLGFDSKGEFAEQFDRAFGHRSKSLAESFCDESIIADYDPLGLSLHATDRQRNSDAIQKTFGIGASKKSQSTEPLERLG